MCPPPTPGCLPVLATSVQSSLCPSPPLGVGVGVLFCFWCLVFLLPHVSWQALTSVAVGQRECSGTAKVGGDSGWLIPDEGAPSSLSPSQCYGATRSPLARTLLPRLPCHECARCHHSPLLLPSAQTVGGGGAARGEVTPGRAGAPGLGSSSCPRRLAHAAHSAPGGEKPPHSRSVRGVPA